MLRISKLTDYGTVVMTELARDAASIVSVAHLANRLKLQPPTLSKILKRLNHAGLVQSYRGAEGGYQLAQPPEQVSVAAIIDALEGPISLTECATDSHSCSQESDCGVRDHWQLINSAVRGALESVSLADMTRATNTRPTNISAEQPMIEIPLFGKTFKNLSGASLPAQERG